MDISPLYEPTDSSGALVVLEICPSVGGRGCWNSSESPTPIEMCELGFVDFGSMGMAIAPGREDKVLRARPISPQGPRCNFISSGDSTYA